MCCEGFSQCVSLATPSSPLIVLFRSFNPIFCDDRINVQGKLSSHVCQTAVGCAPQSVWFVLFFHFALFCPVPLTRSHFHTRPPLLMALWTPRQHTLKTLHIENHSWTVTYTDACVLGILTNKPKSTNAENISHHCCHFLLGAAIWEQNKSKRSAMCFKLFFFFT